MGRLKETLFDADVQPETFRAAALDFQIAECAEQLNEMISKLAVAEQNEMKFLIDDLRTEIMFLNDTIRRQ